VATAIFRGPPWAARPAQLIFAGWLPQDERDNETRCRWCADDRTRPVGDIKPNLPICRYDSSTWTASTSWNTLSWAEAI